MKNPVPYNDLYATPHSLEELTDMIRDIGSSEEQRMAWLGASMALNLAHNLIEELHVREQL